jgi:hypothetical protein
MIRAKVLNTLVMLCAVAATSLAAIHAPASAAPALAVPTPAAQAQLRALLTAAATKVNATLDRDPKLREALRADLEAIGKITSPKARSAAIDAFQIRHGEAYARVLVRAGVDLSALATRMNAMAPAHEFRAEPKRHFISARMRAVFLKRPIPPLVVRRTTAVTAFESDNATQCGAVSQNALPDGVSMQTDVSAFMDCKAVITRSARVDVPDVREAQLRTPFEFSVWAEAVTIGGMSHATAVVSTAVCPGGSLYAPALERVFPCAGDQLEVMRKYAAVFVIGFWGAETSDAGAESQARIALRVNRTGTIFAINSHAWSGSAAAGWAKTRSSNRGYAVTLETTEVMR